jgi:Contractile injection system tube protein
MGCLDFLLPLKLGAAEIAVLTGQAEGEVLHVSFVLKTFRLDKKNEYVEASVPGLDGQPLQFVRGRARTLSMVLHFDGRDTNTDVLQLMGRVARLISVDRDTHAPPVIRFLWQQFALQCVLESLREEFISLFPDGRPSRGRMYLRFTEFKTLEQLLDEQNLQ